jgi:hypothetical protein
MQTLADRAPNTWCPLGQIRMAILFHTPPSLRMAPAREVAEPLRDKMACVDFSGQMRTDHDLLEKISVQDRLR